MNDEQDEQGEAGAVRVSILHHIVREPADPHLLPRYYQDLLGQMMKRPVNARNDGLRHERAGDETHIEVDGFVFALALIFNVEGTKTWSGIRSRERADQLQRFCAACYENPKFFEMIKAALQLGCFDRQAMLELLNERGGQNGKDSGGATRALQKRGSGTAAQGGKRNRQRVRTNRRTSS